MRKTILLAGMILFAAAASRAQETPGAEVSASYSYLRFGVSNGVNQNGASVSVAGNFNHWLGLAGDIGGYHKSEGGAPFNTYTFMGGTRFSRRQSCRVVPVSPLFVRGGRCPPR